MLEILKAKKEELQKDFANQLITAEAMEVIEQKVAEYRKELVSVLEKKHEEEKAFIGVKMALLDELIAKATTETTETTETIEVFVDNNVVEKTTEAVNGF